MQGIVGTLRDFRGVQIFARFFGNTDRNRDFQTFVRREYKFGCGDCSADIFGKFVSVSGIFIFKNHNQFGIVVAIECQLVRQFADFIDNHLFQRF